MNCTSSQLKLCFAKYTKIQATNWVKIFGSHISNEGLVYNIYKKENKQSNFNIGKDLNKTVHKEHVLMTKKEKKESMERYLISLATREMQIQTKTR